MDQAQLIETDGSSQAIKQVLRVCKKGRWLIASAALVTVIATTAGLAFVPSKYRSEATILIVDQAISPSLVTPLSTSSVEQKLLTMKQEVLSRSRLVDIISEFGLFANKKIFSPEAAVELMLKDIGVDPIEDKYGQFSAFSISFTAETPQLAQNVTRTLASLFVERSLATQANRARSNTDFIQEQLAQKRRRLEDIDQRIQNFRTQYFGELPEDRAVNEERRREARTQLDTTTASLNRAKGQRTVWESTLIGDLTARVTRLKTERAALLKNFTSQHPEVVGKDDQIAQVEAELQWVRSGAPPAQKPHGLPALADTGIAQLEGQLQANALEVDSLSNEAARQTATVVEYEHRLNVAPTREQQLADMTRESAELNADIEDVLKKQQQTGLAIDMESRQEGQQFKQLDPASLPVSPSSPQRLKISLAAAGAGVLLGFILAFLLDLRNPSFHSEDELRQRFAPPLLLSVPALLTPREQRARFWKTGFELVVGSVLTVSILAVEYYVYRHP